MYRNTSAPSSVYDYSYKVLYLSEYLMVLEPVSDVGRRVVFMSEEKGERDAFLKGRKKKIEKAFG